MSNKKCTWNYDERWAEDRGQIIKEFGFYPEGDGFNQVEMIRFRRTILAYMWKMVWKRKRWEAEYLEGAFNSLAQLVKNLPAMQKTPVQFLGQEDPLEKG